MDKKQIVILPFESFTDYEEPRGTLTFMEEGNPIPFDIKRVFYVRNVRYGQTRGGHAHKTCEQVIVPIRGSVCVVADGRSYIVSDYDQGIYIPTGVHVEYTPSIGGITMVLASELYDEADYIR